MKFMEKLRYDKVLFIGSFAHGKFLDELVANKVYTQFAANTVEKYYIDGFSKELGLDVEVLSALVTVPYPHIMQKNIKADVTMYEQIKITNVGFRNSPYINQISQGKSIKRFVREWVKKNNQKKILVVVYALRIAFLKAAMCIKKSIPDATVICIVPDLPQYMHGNVSSVHKLVYSINSLVIDKLRAKIDGYILYTQSMAEALSLGDKPWTVIEGIFDQAKLKKLNLENEVKENGKFIFFYGGGLTEEYGLKLLVDGFQLANIEDAELHIYGNGTFAEQLNTYTKKNPAIRYFGSVAPDIIMSKMIKADVLVNPRPSTDAFTRYSCPSKVIEYMATGKAALITKLAGIPDDYFDYVYTIDEETVQGMADAMRKVRLESEEKRIQKGIQAQKYICSNKSLKEQMKKVVSLLMEIENTINP